MRETVLEAVLRSADAPSEVQRNRFAAFLKKQYGQELPLRWEQDPALEKGFRMEVGADLYDWSLEGRLRQFRERLEQLNPAGVSVIPLMREAVRNWQPDAAPEEVGSVLTVGDEIATVSGLEHAAYGEILQFSSGVKGMVQDLRPDRVGCILFGGSEAIESGSIVRRTGKTAGIPVGDGFLGRVVDALGAGDAFIAAFLAEYHAGGGDLADAAQKASVFRSRSQILTAKRVPSRSFSRRSAQRRWRSAR